MAFIASFLVVVLSIDDRVCCAVKKRAQSSPHYFLGVLFFLLGASRSLKAKKLFFLSFLFIKFTKYNLTWLIIKLRYTYKCNFL